MREMRDVQLTEAANTGRTRSAQRAAYVPSLSDASAPEVISRMPP